MAAPSVFGALPLAALTALAAGCMSGQRSRPLPRGSACSLKTLTTLTSVTNPGELARSFGLDRVAMHAYLYNGDDLWPKKANLCARGRNALLDLELGPGASFDLGLFGAAWKAHVHAVAVSNSFRTTIEPIAGTRFLAVWPTVSDGMTRWLKDAHRFYTLAVGLRSEPDESPGARARWTSMNDLARRLAFDRFLLHWKLACRPDRNPNIRPAAGSRTTCGARPQVPVTWPRSGTKWPQGLLDLAQRWGLRLTGALLHRLGFSAEHLRLSVDGIDLTTAAGRQKLSARILRPGERAAALLERYTAALIRGSIRTGTFFPFAEYDTFRQKHLTACVPPYGCGLSVFQLEAIEQQLVRRSNRLTAAEAAILDSVRRDLDRLRFILKGQGKWASAPPPPSLVLLKKRYEEITARMEKDRVRLGRLARTWFAERGSRRLSAALRGPGQLVAASSFYFETEHLNEALSGFTHVAVIQRLGRIGAEPEGPWQLDRVLGFHYVYPVRLLKNSIPVELVELDRSVLTRKRRYAWVRLEIPRNFIFPDGKSSPWVSLVNIFFHLKARLARCPHLRITPGFYYAGATWMLNHPHNRAIFRTCWRRGTHMGFSYRWLDPTALQRLKGKTLIIPVEYTRTP